MKIEVILTLALQTLLIHLHMDSLFYTFVVNAIYLVRRHQRKSYHPQASKLQRSQEVTRYLTYILSS